MRNTKQGFSGNFRDKVFQRRGYRKRSDLTKEKITRNMKIQRVYSLFVTQNIT